MGCTISTHRINTTTAIPAKNTGDTLNNILNQHEKSKRNTVSSLEDEDEDDDDIDANYVYSALFKLAYHFEINESAPKKLISVIRRRVQSSSNSFAQCREVRAWARSQAKIALSFSETRHLIKYVELYTPSSRPIFPGEESPQIKCTKRAKNSKVLPDHDDNFDCSHLICPFRCHMAAWRAEINRQILSKSVALYSDTVRNLVIAPSHCL